MRGLFGLVGLLVALAVVGVLVRKQMTTVKVPVPSLQTPADSTAHAASAPGHHAMQSQQITQQVKQAVESAMQARPMPEEDK